MMAPGKIKSEHRQVLSLSAPYVYGLLVILISALVMLGWIIENPVFVQLHEQLPPMQFNTAVCFFLAGVGICLLNDNRKYQIYLVAGSFTVIALLTVYQYIFNAMIGIDTALIKPFTIEHSPSPGRMGLDAAICFLLTGSALMASAHLKPLNTAITAIIIIMLASITISLSVLQLLVHVSNVETKALFGGYSFMSVQTSLAFVVANIGIIVNAYAYIKKPHLLLPIPVFFGIFFATIYLMILMDSYADYRLRTIVTAKLSLEAQKLTYRMNNIFQSLDRLQDRTAQVYMRLNNFAESDINSYLKDYEGIMPAIAIITQKKIVWFYGKNEKVSIDNDFVRRLISDSLAGSDGEFDKLIVMKHDSLNKPDDAMLLYIDGLSDMAGQQVYLLSLIDTHKLIQSFKINDESGRYYLTVKVNGEVAYQDAGVLDKNMNEWTEKIVFYVKGDRWDLYLAPTEVLVKEFYSRIPMLSAMAGFFIALLASLSVYFGLKSRSDTEKLRDNQEYLNAILNGSAHSIIATQIDGTIMLFNRAAEKMLGYKAVDVIGKVTPEIIHDKYEVKKRSDELTKELGYKVEPGFATFVAKLQNNQFDENEWLYIRKDGSKFPVFLSVYGIRKDGKLTGYVGIAQDISDRKALEATKNEFISAVSHELRTPLTAIKGSIGLLLGGALGDLDEKMTKMLKVAYNNCERLIRLINDILDIEKIEAGKMSYRYEDVNINQLLDEVVEANRTLGLNHSIRLKLTRSRHNIVVVADKDKLNQVFTNLISNAIKFSDSFTTVHVRVSFHKGKVRVAIKDRGIGISETDKKHVFEKFMQVDPTSTRRKGGTGLGLSISQKIVEQMHGYIDLRSRLGKGTTFIVTLTAFKYDDTVKQKSSETQK